MSSKRNTERKVGTITEALPSTLFRVRLDKENKEILAYLAGKMRKYRIKILVGDKVEVEMDPYEGRSRIIRRL